MSETAMKVVGAKPDQAVDDPVYKLLHDLRGPLVNIKGFSRELRIATKELRQSIERQRDSLAADARHAIDDLLENDIDACLNFLESSIEQMDERLDGFESLRGKSFTAQHTGNSRC